MLATADYLAAIPDPTFPACGRLTRSVGLLLESTGPDLPVGTLVKVSDHKSEVVCRSGRFSRRALADARN